MLDGKKIVLGVTGSIAAYKAVVLVRLLTKAGADVKVIMTHAAKQFITPTTLSTIAKNPVHTEFIDGPSGTWNNHVDLGRWADALVIAPASANTIARMAHGQCDSLLTAVYLSATSPTWVAPCMDLDMWKHPATQHNMKQIASYHTKCIDPTYGELASGLIGVGRMAEPKIIVQRLEQGLGGQQRLAGKRALVTAGPTYESIDPVRFIGNHASGKMGFAVAEALANEGARVELVSGPTACTTTHANITLQRVTSACEMLKACETAFPNTDIAVLTAAVSDYKPAVEHAHKLKKTTPTITLDLALTPDIAATLGKTKKPGQLLIGFALETNHEEANAIQKMKSKNFDCIILNSLRDKGAGFGHDTNKISLIDTAQKVHKFTLKHKTEVAVDIVNTVIEGYV